MGGKFCFFTDPAKLAAQTTVQAFGPAAATPGKDRFRVTDVHQATGAKAYAVCRGQTCLQAVRNTIGDVLSLNLVLRPLVQPPFDFPYVEYYIYRGITNASIPAFEDQLGRENVSAETDGGKWGNLQPLDHLFRYAGGAELAIVEAGDVLGEFGPTCGFEVVVQHYGAQPYIVWTRSADETLDAVPLSAGMTAQNAYVSRRQREALGCFVDPCAFWGMFWSDGLAVTGEGAKRGKPLHDLLFAPVPGIFANRQRLYLDIRNETGLSYDFYGQWQDQIKTGPSASPLAQATYSTGGWPIHYQDPGPAELHVRLRRTGAPIPLLYLRGEANPFRTILDTGDATWTQPVSFRRPVDSGASPPCWFTAHYLRGETGTAAATPAAGAFDTSRLQFGPIGDRVVAAYRQLWPATASSGPGTTGYERLFVTDKVLRHDGGVKVDPLVPARSLAYDRVGETSYVFQKGTGANLGKDSVVVFQRRTKQRERVPSGAWSQANNVKISSSGGAIDFDVITGKLLANLVSITLAPGITVPSRLDLRTDTPDKAELFDYTILLLSKAAFDPAVVAAAGTGRPPGPGEKHPTFLSLTPKANPPSLASACDLGWQGWDGQAVIGSAGFAQVYSADGILFASPDFDRGSLFQAGTQQVDLTPEEKDGEVQWDSQLSHDTLGTVASVQMPGLADAFANALAAIGTATPNPPAALLALVEQYGPAIWNRAVEVVKDATLEEWADRLLYYARLKMTVALKRHALVATDPELSVQLVTRFEALSRNYAGLDFAGAAAGRSSVIVTGFDPFSKLIQPKKQFKQGDLATKQPNPSARLALHFAANPDQNYSGAHSRSKTFHIKTCIFPNRYSDFDNQIVERTLEAAVLTAAAAGAATEVKIVCTVSLDDNISIWAKGHGGLSHLFCKIDGFAGMCRSDASDNLYVLSKDIDVATLPPSTDRKPFYSTQLKLPHTLSDYDRPKMRVRYDPSFRAKGFPVSGQIPLDDVAVEVAWNPRADPLVITVTGAIEGSGGNYFSNESYYRSSNLIQSKYTGIKNGHIHIPSFGSYLGSSGPVDVKAADLAEIVVAVLDGVV